VATWQDLLDDVWAKSPRKGEKRGELLTEHTREVLLRLAQLARRFPQVPELVGDERLWHRLFWACCLHDWGKVAPPFQDVLRDRPTAEREAWSRAHHRHEVGSLGFVPWVAGDDEEDAAWIAATIVSHHRDADEIERQYDPVSREGLDLPRLFGGITDRVLAGLAGWLSEIPAAWPAEGGFATLGVRPARAVPAAIDGPTFRNQLAGDAVVRLLTAYARLRRRLEDEPADSPLNRRALVYRGLMLLADRLGSTHAPDLAELRVPGADKLLPEPPRDHQRRAAAADGSIVLAAPTGSGKTEAALLWAGRQQQTDYRPTLLYLLPYRASVNAMHERLEKTVGKPVGLLHAHATQVLFRRFLSSAYSSRQADAAARIARNLTGLQQPAARVATPYQVLRAAYRLKGYEPLWASLSGSLVVVDEVHAYEPQRLGMFLGLLAALVRDWDVRVCAVTATMPSWLRALLVDAIGAQTLSASEEDFAKFGRHRLVLRDGEIGDGDTLDWIARMVQQGTTVLVAVNTVRRAQEVYALLEQRLSRDLVRLLHSRFTGRHRLALETELLERMGIGAARRPVAAVATQTIEVSLNLDFDTIVSEPAPLEALAQRFGRVNRTGRVGEAPVHVLRAPSDGQGIYRDDLVANTLAVFSAVDGERLDEARLGELIDGVYRDGLADWFAAEVRDVRRRFERACIRTLRAFQSDDDLEDAFTELFDGIEVLPTCFEGEYQSLARESMLAAQELLVPISGRQLHRLRALRLTRRLEDRTTVVDVPYHEVDGLRLDLAGSDMPQND
jgi:CRISPR-associated endonuclease/helicase Cas3